MYFLYSLAAILFAACQTKNVTEAERFDSSVRKELPFAVDSLRWLDGVDMATYRFACRDYVSTPPDGGILEHLRQLTLRRMTNDGRYTAPGSQ